MKHPRISGFALLVAFLFSAATATAAIDKLLKPSASTKVKDDTTAVQMGDYKGPKHAIGVLDMENEGGFFSEMTLGDNMRLMLESSLFATNRFIIVERGDLGAVMAEQDLQASKRTAKAADVAQTGRLRSARFLAAGAITEASTETSGEGLGVNIKGIRLGGSSTKASIVLVVKLIDSTSGEIVASERIRGEAGKSKLNVGYTGRNWGGDLGAFARTPLGEAAQDCINQAVKFIATQMVDQPIEGTVATIAGEEVIITMGETFGVRPGQTFVVRKQGEVITDPSTGEVLDRVEGDVTGVIEVTKVREKVSYCKLVSGEMPARGDTVVFQ